jgi:DNA polymerase III delta prime subunit
MEHLDPKIELDGTYLKCIMEITNEHRSEVLAREIAWFEQITNASLSLYFKKEDQEKLSLDYTPPKLPENATEYSKIIHDHALETEERFILILALAPQLKPQSLDVLQIKNTNLNAPFIEFGGIRDALTNGFVPTLETACFLLGGYEMENRLAFLKRFDKNHVLFQKGILALDSEQAFGLHHPLQVSQEYLGLITTGSRYLPQFGTKFPAKEISTEASWADLIVPQHVKDSLLEIKDWMLHSNLIMNDWGLSKSLKPGYRVMFFGPPGTGKTMAASLLGKSTKRPVFRVDLSLIVSKYIGETEKNLGSLFDEAEHKDWILFFDEADALFGRRSQTKEAHDRYANQEVAYLLQRIEYFSGLVVLATNTHSNIDDAFTRRFQSMIHFPRPGKEERKKLWERLLRPQFSNLIEIDMDSLTEKYELTGGEMINVLRYCALEAAKRNEKKILESDLLTGIKREYSKQHKTL